MNEPERAHETVGEVLRVLDRAGVPIARLDTTAAVIAMNSAFALACGRPEGELVGASLLNFTMTDDHDALRDALDSLLDDTAATSADVNLRLIGADGKVRLLQVELGLVGEAGASAPAWVLCVAHDRSQQRRRDRSERRARLEGARAAMTDEGTGLPNRRGLELMLSSAARRSGRDASPFALLRCELDLPTELSDGFEEIARSCVERLRQRLRSADSVSRLEPTVLAVVAEDLHDEQDAAGVAYRLLSTTVEPVPHREHEVRIGMTIGIAMADGSSPPNTLLAAAAQAAGSAGQGGFQILDMRGLDSL